jgi:hypothetical protein
MPVAPSARAINAITKNVSAQLNMMHLPFRYSVNVGSLAEPTMGQFREQVVLMNHDTLVAIGMPKSHGGVASAALAANPGFSSIIRGRLSQAHDTS